MASSEIRRRPTRQVRVIGGGAPIVVQSMTNTDTADAKRRHTGAGAAPAPGSELVRITVNTAEAAAQVAAIRERLDAMGCDVPLVGDFHFNGHKLLTQYPDCAQALAKYRINPGNVGQGPKRDEQFATMIEFACRYDKPVRIGVNWGSLDQELLARMMDENARLRAARCGCGDARSADRFGPGIGGPRRKAGASGRPHRALLQGERRAGPDRGVPRTGAPLRLSRCTWA